MTFKDGATTLGTGTLNASGQATFTTSSLALGSHSITAVYGGGGAFTPSNSPVLTQTVGQAATTTAVSSSPNTSAFGQAVTFTAWPNALGFGDEDSAVVVAAWPTVCVSAGEVLPVKLPSPP